MSDENDANDTGTGIDSIDYGAEITRREEEIAALRDAAEKAGAGKPFALHTAPGSGKAPYQVRAGETLEGIASSLGLASAYQELFKPNMAAIEEAAHNAGFLGGSDQGTILAAGTWLEVPAHTLLKPLEFRI